ncbi:threonine synthase [Eubacterium pyruvativorans]|uniref:threonine synthase n=1 Tax=Eubacterium pyruvativorans TaxID=155865 RepID=UPI0008838046|nr:threonine synthase [Eubacterium pyruvativorans]SDE83469.1 threonine synthase [Eubacterium pyruvativorans]
MKFRSTRGYEREMTGAEAVIQGIAPDRGLFVPTEIPEMPFDIAEMQGKSYQEVAKAIIGLFFDDYTEEEMQCCIDGAYDGKFEAEEIVPVVKAGDAWFLELYHGKTAAFKDMALSILPYLLTTAMKKQQEDKKICILTATSGDTGKAALEGFADVEGTEIIVFFPNHGVSQIQQKQMTSQEGSNVHVFAIEGNFDDAQTGVKNIFQDESVHEALLKEGVKLSSANSINIGRLVPQIAYYVYSYIKLLEQGALKCGDPVNVVVPTGNFGNILAAYYAKRMGLPVKKLICASNRNNVLTDFLRTGVYDTNRAFYQTNSPSMDILVSSNLERLLYHLSGEDAGEIRRLMADLDEKGRYEVPDSIRAGLSAFSAGFAGVEETDQTIGAMYRENHYLFDTHTAVAYKVYEDYRRSTGDETPTLIASTASAYKFASSVAESLGVPETDGFRAIDAVHEYTGVPVPRAMSGLEEKPVLHDQVIDRTEMKEAVLRALS